MNGSPTYYSGHAAGPPIQRARGTTLGENETDPTVQPTLTKNESAEHSRGSRDPRKGGLGTFDQEEQGTHMAKPMGVMQSEEKPQTSGRYFDRAEGINQFAGEESEREVLTAAFT